jgi:2-iminobutanoate/2-iminopropanoate deaminase
MSSDYGKNVPCFSSPPDVWPGPSYHHVARAGDFLFLAGQIGRDEDGVLVGIGDAGVQAAQVYKNVRSILASVGAGPGDVIKVTTMLVNRADNPAVTAERLLFFGEHRPPHTGMIVAGLGSADVLLEVEVVAFSPRSVVRNPEEATAGSSFV